MAILAKNNSVVVTASAQTGNIALDPREIALGADGVAQFSDPAPRESIEVFRDVLLPQLAAFGRSQASPLDRDVIACCTGIMTLFSMQCFQASLLMRKFAESGQKFEPPQNDFLFDFANGTSGHVDAAATVLRRGFPPRAIWKAPARAVRNMLRGGEIAEREFLPVDLDREIVTIAMSPLHQKHAGACDRKVLYCHPGRWLRPVNGGEDKPGLNDIADGLIRCVRNAYKCCDENFDKNANKQISLWAESFPRIIQDHLRSLSGLKLPRRLWIGSASPPLYRMLAHAVRAEGGDVTGHDHGTSVGFFTRNVKGVNDFEGIDRFLTMTEDQATGLRQTLRNDILVRPDVPEIGVVPGARCLTTPGMPAGRGVSNGGKKVMLVTNLYSGSRVWMYPHESDITLLDWRARLITWLKRQGYEVLLKPNPECVYGLHGSLAALGVDRVLSDAFGRVCSEADILLYDYPMTTTFAEGLASDRPIVFVGFELDVFDQKALKKLGGRCAVVRGGKSSDGRRQVDWDELSEALLRAPGLCDPGFFEAYFAY